MTLIGNYPNTYTFTKSMAERTLKKKQSRIPISVVRPSIIICCYKDPFIGWTDTLSAAGGITFGIGTGLMQNMHADTSSIIDCIPCDTVTNSVII